MHKDDQMKKKAPDISTRWSFDVLHLLLAHALQSMEPGTYKIIYFTIAMIINSNETTIRRQHTPVLQALWEMYHLDGKYMPQHSGKKKKRQAA